MTDPPVANRRFDRQFQHAVDLLERVAVRVSEGIPADATTSELLHRMPSAGARDRRLYRNIIFTYFRWLGWTNRIAPASVHDRCAWAVLIDPGSGAAMVDTARTIAGIGAEDARQLVAVRDLVATGRVLSRITGTPLQPDHLVPPWLAGVLPSAPMRLRFIESIQQRPPTWLTVPAARVTGLVHLLEERGIAYRQDTRIAGAVAVDPPFPVVSIEQQLRSALHVQDIASQGVVVACAASTGERWWDACSGSGGKTLGLARAVGASGSVVATDIRETILENLRRRATAHRLSTITPLLMDASTDLPPGAPFDGVLVDAPCSGLGTWSRNPDARWRTTSDVVVASARRQHGLLAHAADAVRPGGALVYAVCSPAPAEGKNLVEAFLARCPEFQCSAFAHPLTGTATGGMVTIWPDEGPGDGMFIARLRRRLR